MIIDALTTHSSPSITYVQPTAMNEASREALSDLQREFRRAGWKYETLRDSALCEWIWTKGDRTVTLTGWHGSTSYGNGMVFWEVLQSTAGQLQAHYGATGYPVGGSSLPSSEGGRCRLFAAKDCSHYLTQILPATLAAARAGLVG